MSPWRPGALRWSAARACSALVLILAATLGVCGFLRHAKAVSPSAAHFDAAGRGPPVLWDVPPFAFEDAHGQFIRDSSLHGHVWVADFIFTRCTSVCPMITAEMTLLRRTIRSPGVRFVSFSINPEFDTREVLEAYGTRWDADPRWLLLRPGPSRVVDFAKGMHVPFERSPDPDEPLFHTSVFFLVDGDGRVRGLYGSLDEPSVARLVADMNVLDSVAESAPGSDNAASSRKPAGATSASRGLNSVSLRGVQSLPLRSAHRPRTCRPGRSGCDARPRGTDCRRRRLCARVDSRPRAQRGGRIQPADAALPRTPDRRRSRRISSPTCIRSMRRPPVPRLRQQGPSGKRPRPKSVIRSAECGSSHRTARRGPTTGGGRSSAGIGAAIASSTTRATSYPKLAESLGARYSERPRWRGRSPALRWSSERAPASWVLRTRCRLR